jgi:hypothetical protein
MEARNSALKRVDPQPGKTLLTIVRQAAHAEIKKSP